MTNCVAKPQHSSEFIRMEVAEAIHSICESYGRGYRRYAGENLYTGEIANRRSLDREAVCLPFYLSPLIQDDAKEFSKIGSPVIAVTRDLSERGIGFRCDVPLTVDQVIAEFDCSRTGQIRLLVEICWNRKQSAHCYLAGGRIIKVLTSHDFV